MRKLITTVALTALASATLAAGSPAVAAPDDPALVLKGNTIKAADTMRVRGECLRPCRISGTAVLRSGGERAVMEIKKTKAKRPRGVKLRMRAFPGAGAILKELGGTVRVKAKVKAPRGYRETVKRLYQIVP